jgi:hypothetical protein
VIIVNDAYLFKGDDYRFYPVLLDLAALQECVVISMDEPFK